MKKEKNYYYKQWQCSVCDIVSEKKIKIVALATDNTFVIYFDGKLIDEISKKL